MAAKFRPALTLYPESYEKDAIFQAAAFETRC